MLKKIIDPLALMPLFMGPMPVGHYLGPTRGPGTGRTAKCKKCGIVGPVSEGPDGCRQIAGCTCPINREAR